MLAGPATTIPKSADGLSEMIRHTKVARDTARKGRTSAIITLKALIGPAPEDSTSPSEDDSAREVWTAYHRAHTTVRSSDY